ncbi:FecR family protein [Peristeroidobacter soli]|jgi:transmembrane sensor|uniref:FecR family protein n=1 Tax=Peristeroidobacter soli TaxID=2497877 RepID=UPI00101D74D7|nr:FecR domain-containing protein [Peristeroidobacter soli]
MTGVRKFRGRWLVAMLLVGGLAVLWMIESERGGLVASNGVTISEIRGEVVAAANNELRNERLPDGSLVAMAPGTRMQFDFAGTRRLVNLQRGRATFTVAHNPAKPFVVQTDRIEAIALGTSFTVSVTWDCVRVDVHGGTVQTNHRGAFVRTLETGDTQDSPKNCSSRVLAEAATPPASSNSTSTGK